MGVLSVPDQDMEVATHACWALAYLTALEEAVDELVDGEGAKEALAQLVAWVAAPPSNLTAPALRVLGNLCHGSTRHTQVRGAAAVAPGKRSALPPLSSSSARSAGGRKRIKPCGFLCACACAREQAVLDAGGLAALLHCLQSSTRTSLRKEIVWSLSNVAAGTCDQVGRSVRMRAWAAAPATGAATAWPCHNLAVRRPRRSRRC